MSDKVKVDGGNSYKDPDFGDNTGYFTLPGSGKDQYLSLIHILTLPTTPYV